MAKSNDVNCDVESQILSRLSLFPCLTEKDAAHGEALEVSSNGCMLIFGSNSPKSLDPLTYWLLLLE